METLIDKARDYILALQDAGNFTYEDMANVSGIAQQTIRNFLTKKTEKNPGFATITKLVISLGGDLNALVGYERTKEIEVNSTVSMKETYEMRIADIISSYEARIVDIKELCDIRVADILRCCENRLADAHKNYEDRINTIKSVFKGEI